jgi:Hsp20/alpha crystallin family
MISGERRRPAEVGAEEVGSAAPDEAAATSEAGPQENKYTRRWERRMGKFERKFNLPENADLEQVSARSVTPLCVGLACC